MWQGTQSRGRCVLELLLSINAKLMGSSLSDCPFANVWRKVPLNYGRVISAEFIAGDHPRLQGLLSRQHVYLSLTLSHFLSLSPSSAWGNSRITVFPAWRTRGASFQCEWRLSMERLFTNNCQAEQSGGERKREGALSERKRERGSVGEREREVQRKRALQRMQNISNSCLLQLVAAAIT